MSDLSTRLLEILHVDQEPYEDLKAHTAWHIGKMLEELRPSDLTAVESLAVAIILGSAHARKLANPPTPIRIVAPLRENVIG